MKHERERIWLGVIAAAAAITMPARAPAGPAYCASAGMGHPEICLRFDNFANKTPTLGADFRLDLESNPDAPSVELLVGRDGGVLLQWRIWCHNGSAPADIGAIAVAQDAEAHDFSVRILNDSGGPGAANLGSVVLTAPSGHYSSIVGSSSSQDDHSVIAGDLLGDLTLAVDSNGQGGLANLVIEGDVSSDSTITVYRPFFLAVGGGSGLNGTMAGTLLLPYGLADYGNEVRDTVLAGTLTGIIDVYDTQVSGHLHVNGGDGEIANGGIVNLGGDVLLSMLGGDTPFTGTATFSSLGYGSVMGGIEFSGTLRFTGTGVHGQMFFHDFTGNGRVLIDHSFGTIGDYFTARLEVYDEFSPTAAFVVDWDGPDEDDIWWSRAYVEVDYPDHTDYWYANHPVGPVTEQTPDPGDHVLKPTACPGDMNNNGSVNAFDINDFVIALSWPGVYAARYPGLDGSLRKHGDINGDGTFNAFDIDPFIALLSSGCGCLPCEPEPRPGGGNNAMRAGAGEGGEEMMSAADAAALFNNYVDPALMSGFVTAVSDMIKQVAADVAAYWSDVLTYLE